MLKRWVKGLLLRELLLVGLCSGLCLHAQANTTAAGSGMIADQLPVIVAQNDLALPPADLLPALPTARIALLLPLRSETLGGAAEVVRTGFMAAYEREPDGIEINLVETGDAPQDVLSGYASASAHNDIIVGPMSRTGVAAVAQANVVDKPTLALTPPEIQEGEQFALPRQMLVMGLSIEDEAAQVAAWAGGERKWTKAFVLHTDTAWQRRAAKAFDARWQQQGLESEVVEVPANDGFLSGRTLLQLKKQIQDDKSVLLFAALDARQARQVRAVLGSDVALYGTSQLNPFALADWSGAERMPEMNGTHLLDLPWQLQPDHPAVMVYPRLVVAADRQRSPDMERLYALGIDAYRVAHEIAAKQTDFQLDGVTGKLKVHFDGNGAQFDRAESPAVYRDGVVAPDSGAPQSTQPR